MGRSDETSDIRGERRKNIINSFFTHTNLRMRVTDIDTYYPGVKASTIVGRHYSSKQRFVLNHILKINESLAKLFVFVAILCLRWKRLLADRRTQNYQKAAAFGM